MNPRTRANLLLAFGLVGATGLLLGYYLGLASRQDTLGSKVREVRNHIEHYYYPGKIDAAALEHATLDGMCSILDRYCEYFTAEEWKVMKESLAGQFYGVGIHVKEEDDGYIKILAPLEGSPAAKANLLPGDKVVAVDGQNIKGWPMDRIVRAIRGKEGTSVTLRIRRGDAEPFDVPLVRAAIKQNPVRAKMLPGEPAIGYLRVSDFNEQLIPDFDKASAQLLESGAKGLVLDLRRNPGGLLNVCVDLCDRFIDGARPLVTIESKTDQPRQLSSKTEFAATEKIPVVVLINEGSASASEIFAGVLQDYKRGLVVGEKSYGKGLVQQGFELHDGSYIKLTVARYLTPNGRAIDRGENKFIDPDVEVKLTAEQYGELYRGWSAEEFEKAEPPKDPQLDKALELLRAKVNGR
jgi:carboxyl-terminal processing protease